MSGNEVVYSFAKAEYSGFPAMRELVQEGLNHVLQKDITKGEGIVLAFQMREKVAEANLWTVGEFANNL